MGRRDGHRNVKTNRLRRKEREAHEVKVCTSGLELPRSKLNLKNDEWWVSSLSPMEISETGRTLKNPLKSAMKRAGGLMSSQ